jgi:hypothetical protein
MAFGLPCRGLEELAAGQMYGGEEGEGPFVNRAEALLCIVLNEPDISFCRLY